jgi:sodium-dependent dicarboxylate transporter 2/3/5
MQETGVGAWIVNLIFSGLEGNPYLIILGLIIFAILLTNIMSNVGAVAILLPIGLAISTEMPGVSPLLTSLIIALSGGLAFMFIIATPANAITYSSGFYSTKDLLKAGIVSNIICIFIIFIIAIFYWKGVLGI